MPLYVGSTQKRRTVKLLTAGEDLYYLSNRVGGTAYLKAIVSDYTNLRNYTFNWVQNTGTPVNLVGSESLEASYVIESQQDIEFTFTLDKGTNREQAKSVTIYNTPTSKKQVSGGSAAKDRETIPETIPSITFEQRQVIPSVSGVFTPRVDAVSAYAAVIANTTVPGIAGKAVRTLLYGKEGLTRTNRHEFIKEYAATNGSAEDFFPEIKKGSYRISIEYEPAQPGFTKWYHSPTFFITEDNLQESPIIVVDDNPMALEGGSAALPINNFRRQIFSIGKYFDPDIKAYSGGTASLEISSFRRQFFNRITGLLSSEIPYSGGSASLPITNFLRLDQSQIGG